jgi:hypothetical protein
MLYHSLMQLYDGYRQASVTVTGGSSDVPVVHGALFLPNNMCPLTGKLKPLSDECHEEVMQLKIWRSKSLDSNPALGECRIQAAAGRQRPDSAFIAVPSSARAHMLCAT